MGQKERVQADGADHTGEPSEHQASETTPTIRVSITATSGRLFEVQASQRPSQG